MATPSFRYTSSNKSRGKDPSVEALSLQAMTARNAFSRGDGDASTTMTEDSARGHSRPSTWKQKVSSDGRLV